MPRKRKTGGFSLIEVLVATAVLAAIALPLTGMLLSSLQGTQMSRLSAEALYTAQSRMEELALTPGLRESGARTLDEPGGMRSVLSVRPDWPEPGLCLLTVEVFLENTSLALLEDVLYAP